MERRRFLGAVGLGAGALALPARLSAQEGRAEWTAEGREPADPAAMSPEELAHVPVLSLPSSPRIGRPFDLAVQIGVTPLAPSDEHHVEWIEVKVDDRSIFVADLSLEVPYPVLRLPIVLGAAGTLVVRARCSVHGVWITRRALTPS